MFTKPTICQIHSTLLVVQTFKVLLQQHTNHRHFQLSIYSRFTKQAWCL